MKLFQGFGIHAFLVGIFALLSFFNTLKNVFLIENAFHIKNSPSRRESVYNNNPSFSPRADEKAAAAPDSSVISVHNVSTPLGIPLCRREQLSTGKWVPLTLAAPPYISKTIHLRCPVPGYDYEYPGPWNIWDWRPTVEDCKFSSWDATEFCDLLPFATVSIIGDSLSWEQYSSLLQLLGVRVHQTHQHQSRRYNHVQAACRTSNRGTKLIWRNNARLKPEFVRDSIEKDFPTVLILNRGAHYVNDTVLIEEISSLLPVLSEWQDTCGQLEQKCHLFWRTSAPGHPNCEKYKEPVNNMPIMETYIENKANYNETTWKFHWQDFQHQNKLVLKLLRDYSDIHGLQYEVIDAYGLNVLRPDSHRGHQDDCLHNCYPGIMDVYNQLLLHLLKMQRSVADSDKIIQRYESYRARKAANQPTAGIQ